MKKNSFCIYKTLMSLFLTMILSFSFFIEVKASSDSFSQSTEKKLLQVAENWKQSQYIDNVTISDIVPIYKTNHALCGYQISYSRNGKSAGYIIISNEERQCPIIQFTLEGESPYVQLSKKIRSEGKLNKYSVSEKALYTDDFFSFSLKISGNNGVSYLGQDDVLHKESIEAVLKKANMNSNSFWDAWEEFPDIVSIKAITGASNRALVMGDMPAYEGSGTAGDCSEGNCGPTALANVINLYSNNALNSNTSSFGNNLLVNSSINDTYKYLSSLACYCPSDGTSTNNAKKALSTYVVEKGYKCNISSYTFNTWKNFTSDVDKNRPILLHVAGKGTDGKDMGHLAVVVGYATGKNDAKYLAVYTGWTHYATYVKFKPDCLDEFCGYGVAISK